MNHKQLDLWNVSVDLATEIHEITSRFPAAEKYGLAARMKAAVVSIASNIAEGAARGTKCEYIRFLHIAAGSGSELDTQSEIILRTGPGDSVTVKAVRHDLDRVARMIRGLIRSLK